ncbi:MAG: peptidylprolyl isomerase, partial [Chlorobi bacterium]|nr:peptidylprolyl isomerase [Chlorobiota bacterium]
AKEAGQDAVSKARKEIEALAERIKKGEAFEELAARYSEDLGSKAKRGDLGFFQRGVMAPSFEEAVYALNPGEISGTVRTDFGFHLIRLDGIQEGKTKSFEEVREEIEKNYAKKMKRLLDKNPVHKKAEETFKESRNNYESDRSKYTKEEKAELNRRIERFNPVSNVELQSKIISDIKLLNFLNNKQLENDASAFVPKRFKLHQNYPNPFNPVTTIKYDIPKDNFVLIKIYDLLGREIFTESEFKKAGRYEVKFDGSNFASGLYFYKFEAGNFVETKKMVLIK